MKDEWGGGGGGGCADGIEGPVQIHGDKFEPLIRLGCVWRCGGNKKGSVRIGWNGHYIYISFYSD